MNCYLCNSAPPVCPCVPQEQPVKEVKRNISSGEDAFVDEDVLWQQAYDEQRENVLA